MINKSFDLQINMSMINLESVVFDTDASLAITRYKDDFVRNTYHEVEALKLGGMVAGADTNGIGEVAWTFVSATRMTKPIDPQDA